MLSVNVHCAVHNVFNNDRYLAVTDFMTCND